MTLDPLKHSIHKHSRTIAAISYYELPDTWKYNKKLFCTAISDPAPGPSIIPATLTQVFPIPSKDPDCWL